MTIELWMLIVTTAPGVLALFYQAFKELQEYKLKRRQLEGAEESSEVEQAEKLVQLAMTLVEPLREQAEDYRKKTVELQSQFMSLELKLLDLEKQYGLLATSYATLENDYKTLRTGAIKLYVQLKSLNVEPVFKPNGGLE